MKHHHVMIFVLALLVLMPAFGQDLPQNIAMFGVGFQSAGAPQISGWADIAHRNPDIHVFGMTLGSFTGLATDYTGPTSSVRASLYTVFPTPSKYLFFGSKTGAGVSTTASVTAGDSNVGGAFDAGAWVGLKMDTLTKVPGMLLIFSVTALKQDISAATTVGTKQSFVDLGKKATFRFGIGKSW